MSSTNNLVDVVRHYQRSIERHNEDETRLLHCITKLFNLPIKFEHLQETGIGKTVNSLRKCNGEVGIAAKTLVTKWKAMVAAEGEEAKELPKNAEDSNRSNDRRSSDEEQDQENKGSNSSSGEEAQVIRKSKDQERSTEKSGHKSRSSSSHNNHHSSHNHTNKTHSKTKSEIDKKHKSSKHEKIKNNEKHHEHRKESSRTNGVKECSTQKPSSYEDSSSNSKHRHRSKEAGTTSSSKSEAHKSDSSKTRGSSTQDKSKETKSHSEHKSSKDQPDKHKSSSSSKSSKRSRSSERIIDESSKSKIPKTQTKPDTASNEDAADEFDSTMGANFDDVLGMLNMPMSSKKNCSSKLKTPVKAAVATSNTSKRKIVSLEAETRSSSRTVTTRKPELLAPTAKLEPLDPSIALELPTISNNYKPMPLNQTVMDVVFNQSSGNHSFRPPPLRHFNESEALAAGISSKTMRTKIYSGVKTGQILQVASLFDLCTRVLQKNIDALEYTGGVPFEVLRPVLERATPQQLLNVEEYNPYLMDDSEVLWQKHVQRQCRSQQREEMETWREMFLRCQEEKERKLSILAESIKASQKISEAPVRKTQMAFVDSMVKPPRSIQRKQEQYGTKGKLIATPAARVAALSSVTPNAAKVGDARLRVLGSGRDTAQVVAGPVRPKKAPLMMKTLQFMRGRHKR